METFITSDMPISVSLCRMPTDKKYASSQRLTYTGIFQAKHHIYLPTAQYDSAGKQYRFQIHDGIEILCVTDGEGVLRLSSKEILMKKGDICLVNPYEPHMFSFDNTCCERICVVFFPRLFLSGAYQLSDEIAALASGKVCLTNAFPDNDAAREKFRAILYELVNSCFAKTPYTSLEIHGSALKLLACILENKAYFERCENLPIPSTVYDIIQYLDKHLYEDISSAAVAKHFNYTIPYFCRLFRKYFGTTFTSYIHEARISAAKTILLQENDILISELAFRVGFNDANYFSFLFRKNTGFSPSEFVRKTT